MLREIRLHGTLGERFGGCHKFDVVNAPEAVRALCLQVGGFRDAIAKGRWHVIVGNGMDISDPALLPVMLGPVPIHIVPAVGGGGPEARAILGATLIVAAFAFGGPLGAGSMAAAIPLTAGLVTYGSVALLGASMLFGGIAEMLSTTPKLSGGKSKNESFLFSGLDNVADQGGCVPIVYGRCRVGSVVVSMGVDTDEINPDGKAGQVLTPVVIEQSATGSGGGKTGAGGQRTPFNTPDTLRSRARLQMVHLISEGPCGGLRDGFKSVFVNDVAVQNDDGTYNMHNIVMEERLGLPDQEFLTGFPNVEAQVGVGTEVTTLNSVVRTLSDVNATAVRVTVQVPQLFNAEEGEKPKTGVTIAIDLKEASGDFVEVREDRIYGKKTSAYERDYRIELTGEGPWQVRVRRITEDSEDDQLQNKTFWSSYTLITDHKFAYPNSALIGLSVDAEAAQGNFSGITFDYDGREIQIPTNLDPDTRIYTGVWDGTFKMAVCSNPAWILYDLVTHSRYGLGEFIPPSIVDKWSLYDIGVYCDGDVPDGKGGVEPRFTFNGVLRESSDAWSVLQLIAGVCRTLIYWGAGTVTFACDQPTAVTHTINHTDVIQGIFNYPGAAYSSRHAVMHVTWFNPVLGGKPDIEVVEDRDLIERFGRKVKEVVAMGCNSQGEARRRGLWELDTEKNQGEMALWGAALSQAKLRPGEVAEIFDPAYAGQRRGGRIVDVVLNEDEEVVGVEIDAPVTFLVGQSYVLSIMLPDGTRAARTIAASPGDTTTILFDNPLPAAPVDRAIWGISGGAVSGRPFRILGVVEQEGLEYSFTALLHDHNKFDRIELGITLPETSYTSLPVGPLRLPSGITVSEAIVRIGGVSPGQQVSVSWVGADDPRVSQYEVQYREDDDEAWISAGIVDGTSAELFDIGDGAFYFRVRSMTDTGVTAGSWSQAGTFVLNGLLAPPGTPANLRITILGDNGTLAWTPVSALNLSHYIVRFSPATEGAGWGSAAVLIPQVTSIQTPVPVMEGTYMVKAVTLQGIESTTEALVSSVVRTAARNIVVTLDEHPTWTGAKTDVLVGGLGELKLYFADDIGDWGSLEDVIELAFGVGGNVDEGLYVASAPVDLGEVLTSRVTAALRVAGESVFDSILAWESLADVSVLVGVSPSDWSVRLEMRTTNDDPLDAEAEWSAWQEFQIGDYLARGLDFRLYLFSHAIAVTPIVVELSITIDMPDRVEGWEVTIPVEGIRVTYPNGAFKAVVGTSYMPIDFTATDRLVVTEQDATGLTWQVIDDSTGLPVERQASGTVKGYGRVTAGG